MSARPNLGETSLLTFNKLYVSPLSQVLYESMPATVSWHSCPGLSGFAILNPACLSPLMPESLGWLSYIFAGVTPLVRSLPLVCLFIDLLSSQVSLETELDRCYRTVYVSLEPHRILKQPFPMKVPSILVALKIVLL